MKWYFKDYQKWLSSGCTVNTLVTHLEIIDKQLLNINKINNLPNLQILNCSYNKIKDIEGLQLPNLQTLNCSHNQIVDIQGLQLPNLQKLYCYHNKIIDIQGLQLPNLQTLNCSNNKIIDIEGLQLFNLQKLYCYHNKIIDVQGLQLPNLQTLNCSHNQIVDIQGLQLPNLQVLFCYHNKIINIEGLQLPNLQVLYCSNNKIVDIEGLQLPNLQKLDCSHNQIIDIQGLQLPNLQELFCFSNQIINIQGLQLPNLQKLFCYQNNIKNLSILITNRLNYIDYSNNPVEYIAPNVQRFLNRSKSKQNVYNDSQNVHNHHIQECIRNSIQNIISIKPDIYNVNEYVLNDNVFKETTKQILFEYMSDTKVHSTLQITFEELLQCVLTVIDSNQHSKEIKEILNQEMLDSQCKCYTGRMSRLINCLNGFTDKVKVQISDVEQIGYVIQSVANELKNKQEYTIEKHKEKVKQELLERKYTETIINEWIAYIE